MSGPLVGAVLNDARSRHPAVRFVLCVIAEQQRKPGQPIQLSLAYLCLMTGYGRRHVIDAIAEAEASGDLEVVREDGRKNTYLVLPNDGQPADKNAEPVSSSAPPPVHHRTLGGAPPDTGPGTCSAPTPSVINRTRSERASASGARPPRVPSGEAMGRALECMSCNRTYPVEAIRNHQCTGLVQ